MCLINTLHSNALSIIQVSRLFTKSSVLRGKSLVEWLAFKIGFLEGRRFRILPTSGMTTFFRNNSGNKDLLCPSFAAHRMG